MTFHRKSFHFFIFFIRGIFFHCDSPSKETAYIEKSMWTIKIFSIFNNLSIFFVKLIQLEVPFTPHLTKPGIFHHRFLLKVFERLIFLSFKRFFNFFFNFKALRDLENYFPIKMNKFEGWKQLEKLLERRATQPTLLDDILRVSIQNIA